MFKNIKKMFLSAAILAIVIPFMPSVKCLATEEASLVPINVEGRYGYCTGPKEKIVIAPQFVHAGHFSEGKAAVGVYVNETEIKYGYINSSAKFVIAPQFDAACEFKDGLAIVGVGNNEGKKNGCIDGAGNFVIKPQFGIIGNFCEGLAVMNIFNEYEVGLEIIRGKKGFCGKWGYIDKAGNVKIKPEFDGAQDFKNGRAKVTLNEKSYYIDRKGKKIE